MAKINKVKIKFIKNFGEAKIGDEANCKINEAKKLVKKDIVKIIQDEKTSEARYIQDRETLESPKVKGMGALHSKDIKILNVLPENYERYMDEIETKGDVPKSCLDLLRHPNYLDKITQEVQLKVVGENDSIKTIFLCSAGRLVENNHLASYNLLVNSKSGSGKDFITTATTELWDKSICIKRTRISPTAFTYWHDANLDPDWTWDGKILVLEDISETVLNSDVFKVMQSSGSVATIVVNNKAKDLEIKGKPVIIITTAKASPNIELIRRNSICQLDESQKQTRNILKEQALKAAEGIVSNPNPLIKESLKYLRRVKVKIPYAKLFVDYFPADLIMRTAFNRFIDLIKSSAALHQFQRETDKEGFLLANGLDYNLAVAVMNHLNKEGHTVTLTRDQQEILKVFENSNELYPVDYINSKIPLTDKWLRTQLDRLTEMGFLEVDGIKDDKQNRIVRHYKKIETMEKIYLLQFDELLKNMAKKEEKTEM